MHRAFLFLILTLTAGLPAMAINVETAYTRYYEAEDIRPIRQYFGGALTGQGFRTVLPSQPDEPAGQYFIARLEDAGPAAPAEARLTIILSNTKELATFTWDLSGKELRKWIYLGLTGSDWPSEEIQPMAWHIEFLDSNGQVLADWKSFLWQMP